MKIILLCMGFLDEDTLLRTFRIKSRPKLNVLFYYLKLNYGINFYLNSEPYLCAK